MPGETINNSQRSATIQNHFNGKFTIIPSQYQTINLSYAFNRNKSGNLGIGGFDLPERAFDLNSQSNQIRFSQVGNVWKRFYNEFRVQFTDENFETVPKTDALAIVVLDAFNGGGAGNDAQSRQQSVSIADNFLWGFKDHALKIGGVFDYQRRKIVSNENRAGVFTFAGLNDFLANRPSLFTRENGVRKVESAQMQFGGFLQDDFRPLKSLMLNFGLRYEYQSDVKDVNNFSPRIGFAWSPSETSKTTIRGGGGIFYNWLELNTRNTIRLSDQSQPDRTIIINPGFPNPFLGGTVQILPESFRLKASNLKSPYVFLAQFGVQRQLSVTSSVRFQYSYQKGINQFRTRDINAPLDGARPLAEFGQISYFESSAFFIRNVLKIDYDIAPTGKTYLSVNYRLAKNISDAAGYFGLPSDNYDLRADRSFSSDDQRHNIYTTFVWALPKGLRLSTIFRANSSLPYSVTTGRDDNGDTIFNDRPDGISRNSERGTWQKQFDTSLSWQINLEKGSDNSSNISDPNSQIIRGRTLIFDIISTNIFNQSNFQTFVGNQTSGFFRQPVSATEPRQLKLSMKFSF